MILDLDAAEPPDARAPSWLVPGAAGALLALALVLVFGRAPPHAAANLAGTPAAAAGAAAPTPRGYRPLSQEQLASRRGFAVLSLPASVGTVSQRTLASGVTGLVPAAAMAPGFQVTFTLSDGRVLTLIESTDDTARKTLPSPAYVAEPVAIRGVAGIAYTAKNRDQASFVVWTAEGVRFELWSRTVETAQLLGLAEMLR